MADKLIIVLLETDPFDSGTVVTIASQASVAAAMEFQVEIILSGQCWVLAKETVARSIDVGDRAKRNVADLFAEAHAAGVSFKVCPPPETEWEDVFLDVIDETVGNAYIISEAMNDDTVSFTY